jgi:pimeloyl-ACP methyl ester carboxylesterase
MNSATAGRAAAQDFELFSGDWGFRLEDIRLPVHLWQGSLDRNVPAQHAELLAARIPNATLHRCEGEGHLLFLPRLGEILRTITT